MKLLAFALAVATTGCSGAASSTATSPSRRPTTSRLPGGAAIDPTPFLREAPPTKLRGAVMPRAIWLDVGDAATEPEVPPSEPVEILIVESGATSVRVAVRAESLRFVAWVRREDLLGVLARDHSIRSAFAPPTSEIGATLHRGARVEILERDGDRARIRYSGALEVETWIGAELLREQAAPLVSGYGVPGSRMLQAYHGLPIYDAPRWGGAPIAVLARAYFLQDLGPVDAGWREVAYVDRAIEVRGYVSPASPRVPLHALAAGDQATPLVTNDTLSAGTCLYAHANGEVVGVAGELPAATARGDRAGWWWVTLDTPWGPLRFAARRASGAWAPCDRAGGAPGPVAPLLP